MTVTGLILAAGQGKRLGGVKPLLTHETATLIEMVIANFRASKLDNIILVLGHDARRVVQKIPLAGLKIVINPTPSLGMSASIQRGMAHLATRSEAIMIAMGDMPLVGPETINQLIAAFDKSKKGIAVPVYDKQRGHPVIFDQKKYFDRLLELRGDVGAKGILEANPKDILEVKVKTDGILIDVDTRDDWESIRDRLEMPDSVSSLV
jgi:molybdenum cofactor cytidylyltransferase